MRRILLILFAALVGLGLLAGAGFAGFQIGFREGARASVDAPAIDRGERFRPDGPRELGFGRDFGRDFRPGPGDLHFRGRGFVFLPLRWLEQFAIFALIAMLAVWLFTRSGWTFVQTRPSPAESKPDAGEQPPQNE